MSETETVDTLDAQPEGSGPHRPDDARRPWPLRLATTVLGPLWVTTFRDPVREGHLRLDALSPIERQLAKAGIVLLGLLLASLLIVDVWREGTLFALLGVNELRFVPIGVLPVTLLGFLLAWSMLLWGALDSAPSVRVLMAAIYLVTGATMDVSSVSEGFGAWILEHGPALIHIGYYVPAVVLVVSALASPWTSRRPRLSPVLLAVFRLVAVVGLVVTYGGLVWLHVGAVQAGTPTIVPGLVDGSIGMIGAVLLPLVYVSAIAVIDFALDVSTSLSTPAQSLPATAAKALLLGLVLVKLWIEVVSDLDYWMSTLTYQPTALLRTVVSILGLGLVCLLCTRFPRSETYALAKERVMYGASFVLAGPYLLSVAGVGAGLLIYTQFGTDAANINDSIDYDLLGTEGLLVAGLVAAGVGVTLMRRSTGGLGDELGSALVVVGAWCAGNLVLPAVDVRPGFNYPIVDVLVTVFILVLLLVRWRSISTTMAVTMMTVALFSWLVMSRGDYISFLGGIVGLPAILVLVFGVVLTLASGSAFAHEESKRLPRDARPLLWVGYLLLSVVILHWIEATHEATTDQDALAAFYFLGIPLAAWLLARRIVQRSEEEETT